MSAFREYLFRHKPFRDALDAFLKEERERLRDSLETCTEDRITNLRADLRALASLRLQLVLTKQEAARADRPHHEEPRDRRPRSRR